MPKRKTEKSLNFLLFIPAIAIFTFIGIFVTYLFFFNNKEAGLKKASATLPIAELQTLSGQTFNTKNLTGDFALINFFASWCVSCVVEHEFLTKLDASGVKIYGIAWRDSKDKLGAYLNKHGNPYKDVLLDSDAKFSTKLGVGLIPETIVIVKDKVALKITGPLTEQTANQIIEIKNGLKK